MTPNVDTLSNRRTGFTLLEISIVLVIIGLLVGGIVVGKTLVTSSYIRGIVSDFAAGTV